MQLSAIPSHDGKIYPLGQEGYVILDSLPKDIEATAVAADGETAEVNIVSRNSRYLLSPPLEFVAVAMRPISIIIHESPVYFSSLVL